MAVVATAAHKECIPKSGNIPCAKECLGTCGCHITEHICGNVHSQVSKSLNGICSLGHSFVRWFYAQKYLICVRRPSLSMTDSYWNRRESRRQCALPGLQRSEDRKGGMHRRFFCMRVCENLAE